MKEYTNANPNLTRAPQAYTNVNHFKLPTNNAAPGMRHTASFGYVPEDPSAEEATFDYYIEKRSWRGLGYIAAVGFELDGQCDEEKGVSDSEQRWITLGQRATEQLVRQFDPSISRWVVRMAHLPAQCSYIDGIRALYADGQEHVRDIVRTYTKEKDELPYIISCSFYRVFQQAQKQEAEPSPLSDAQRNRIDQSLAEVLPLLRIPEAPKDGYQLVTVMMRKHKFPNSEAEFAKLLNDRGIATYTFRDRNWRPRLYIKSE